MLFVFSTPVLIRHLWQLKTVVSALVSNTWCSIGLFWKLRNVIFLIDEVAPIVANIFGYFFCLSIFYFNFNLNKQFQDMDCCRYLKINVYKCSPARNCRSSGGR
jgi:hypothetical protein